MSKYQKIIKWLSVVEIIVSVLLIIASLMSCGLGSLAIAGAGASGSSGAMSDGASLAALGGVVALGVGAAGFASSLLGLIVGILGVRGAKDPNKIMPFFVFAIIGLIFQIYNAVVTFMSPTLDASSAISAIASLLVTFVLVYAANKVRQMRTR